jgi:hypothetical protein
MLEDNLMVSVVHCDDIVPRLSRPNIQSLAMEVNKYAAEASKFQKEDQKILEEYAKNYGLTGDMGDDDKVATSSGGEGEGQGEAVVEVQSDASLPLPLPLEELKVVELELPLVVPGKIVHLTFCNGKQELVSLPVEHLSDAMRG